MRSTVELLGYDHRSSRAPARIGGRRGRRAPDPRAAGRRGSARLCSPCGRARSARSAASGGAVLGEALEPGGVADEACVLPEGSANLRRDRFAAARASAADRCGTGRRARRARREPPAGRTRGTRAASSTRAGSRRARRCTRTRRLRRARQLGAPVEVGDDAAHRVVGRGRDRDRLDARGRSRHPRARDHRREAVAVDRAEVEQRCAARSDRRATTSRGASSSVKRCPPRRAGARPRRAAPR